MNQILHTLDRNNGMLVNVNIEFIVYLDMYIECLFFVLFLFV